MARESAVKSSFRVQSVTNIICEVLCENGHTEPNATRPHKMCSQEKKRLRHFHHAENPRPLIGTATMRDGLMVGLAERRGQL